MNHRKVQRMGFHREPHGMTRVDVETGIPFEEFIAALEKAAPPVDQTALERILAAGGSWDDVRADAAENAPNDLMTYAKIDTRGYFPIAGHHTPAVEYLIGNHVIAETMFRHDPKALLYAPLRVLIHSDADGTAILSIDQPSTAFASLGNPEISAVGRSLDQKVAALLRAIGVDTGEVFEH
jgi:uncharacterized protein (DUF302 family)